MPTYHLRCRQCELDFNSWRSIKSDEPFVHPSPDCGGELVVVFDVVRTHGVGTRGQRTIEVDTTEARWSKDMAAYKRLRHEGHQPETIDGAARLEVEAKHEFAIRYGLEANAYDDRDIKDRMEAVHDVAMMAKEA